MTTKTDHNGTRVITTYEFVYGDIIGIDMGGYCCVGCVLASTPDKLIMKLDPNRSGRINDDGWLCALATPSIVEIDKSILTNCSIDVYGLNTEDKNNYTNYIDKAAKMHDSALYELALEKIGDQTYGGKDIAKVSKLSDESIERIMDRSNVITECKTGSAYA